MKTFNDLLPAARGGVKAAPRAQASQVNTVKVTAGGEGSLSVRKIDNGYITRTSRWANGRYVESEVFSEAPPTIEVKK